MLELASSNLHKIFTSRKACNHSNDDLILKKKCLRSINVKNMIVRPFMFLIIGPRALKCENNQQEVMLCKFLQV